MVEAGAKIRLDKWLWHARFFKTRTLAAKVVQAGHCRVNGVPVAKPAYMINSGDVLTFPQMRDVRVIRMVAPGDRRGPAPEAQALYEDLDPPKPREREPEAPKYEGGGRPTKKDRRQLDKARPSALE
ncbi:RNA-binding S4 domain-containing protein [Antarctobacter jejuensis]|uniref:RNA-binding S4 domain-containing protein n=1 Tax=Antarctobacter jejuensis TaxID=1439938 RepID=UPI003FD4F58B